MFCCKVCHTTVCDRSQTSSSLKARGLYCVLLIAYNMSGKSLVARKELNNRSTLLHNTGHIVTTKNMWIAIQVSLVCVTVIALIGLYTFIHLTHCVHNNVGVQSFIY